MSAVAVANDAWLRAVWHAASDAMALSDADGMVLAANPAYYALYGFAPDQVLGHSFAIIFPATERAAAEQQYREIFQSLTPPPLFESTIQRRDGAERIVASRISFLEEAGQRVAMLSTVQDVTEQVQARRVLARAEAERRDLISSLSHDLRSPLTAIKGQAQLLRRQTERRGSSPPAETLVPGLTQIEASAVHLARLIDDLVAVSRVDAGQVPPLRRTAVDLASLARAAVDRHQRLADAHQLVSETPSAPLVGRWDEPSLERVLDNLLSNAIKYSPEGGTVTVRVERRAADVRGIPGDQLTRMDSPHAATPRPGALLTVQDAGIGILAADLPHVFDRFWRSQQVTGVLPGSGVGLASVKQIVEQHEGWVDVASREGAGTTVSVWLPLEPSPAVAADDTRGPQRDAGRSHASDGVAW